MNSKESEFEFIKGLSAELSSKNLVFPTSLKTTMKIRRALDTPDISNDQVARIVSAEPVLSAQVLKLANSAMFNRSGKKVEELRGATVMLGFGVVRNVAISVGMKQLKDHQASGQSSERMEGLWTRSMRVAALSFVLARNLTRLSPDKAMIAGLLHDVGKFYILNRACLYQDLFVSEQALWELVDQWHVDIGAAILDSWEISEDIRAAVMDHKALDLAVTGRAGLTDVVAAANFLDAHFVAQSLATLDWANIPAPLQNLQLDPEKTEKLMKETTQELSSIMQILV
ncbi:HDOD domain-containing protein [Undibacterium piscinae]|jgi:putative nucleotidyltransferase with HDIG domain|uniref:HDOD domain-containing protein n=1 Tax=Undibacterium piscinae TaxID=2495591 RepID=A0A6M4ACB7_9BURK|nr:HDOD domain-containing protein [Undibacterium piscinae]